MARLLRGSVTVLVRIAVTQHGGESRIAAPTGGHERVCLILALSGTTAVLHVRWAELVRLG